MIVRSFNTVFLNSVLAHPAVSKGARIEEGMDISSIVNNMDNYFLATEHGGFLIIKVYEGVYECHTQFLPEGRGSHVREAVKAAFDYMFLYTDCTKVITKAYKDNPASVKLSDEFFNREGSTGDYHYYSREHKDWIISEANQKEGEGFHDMIGEDANHVDDTVHDCYVGACMRTALAGNAFKAVELYNNWAYMSGYEPLILRSVHPVVVSAGDMILEITGEVRVCL